MTAGDPDDLERFVAAQAPVYESVERELRGGRKHTHWMWFIFPQLRGLGRSANATFFGITSLAQARAYLAHPVLGTRLAACTKLVLEAADGITLDGIFGAPDDAKFCSSMTLFRIAAHVADNVFERALRRYCGGIDDERTLAFLGPSTEGKCD